MDLLRALYNSYNYAYDHKMVDDTENGTILLPLYHNSLRSTGENVVEIELNSKGEFFDAYFVEKDKYLVFPITYNSSTRSGKMPPPHPLLDKGIYLIPSKLEHHKLYREEFLRWKNAINEEKVYEFLDLIDSFVCNNWFNQVLKSLFKDFQTKDLVIKVDKKEYDFAKIYFSFKIRNFINGQDKSISDYVELHNSYIDYVESNLTYDGICNISGQEDFISRKHRGVFGNSKLVSVSNNKETYIGRFKSDNDVFNLGYRTSEKAHLMLRYLTENGSSNQFLGENQYLLNWFSDDISNTSNIDLLDPNESSRKSLNKKIVSKQNEDIGSSFFKGVIQFNKDANYYILLLDKSSAGRVSIKYFKSLPVSELLERLKKWNDLYNWPTYIEEKDKIINKVPSFYNIMLSCYGVERDERLIIDNVKFYKDQIQKMIAAMLQGEKLPQNIRRNLANNIRLRTNYGNTWNQMKRVALSVLRNEREKRYENMLDKSIKNRSYLYGRLMAVYEVIERATYFDSKDKSDIRLTNAEKFWTAFINNPTRTQISLERNVRVYLNKLKKSSGTNQAGGGERQNSKMGLAIKYEKTKSEIIEDLSQIYKENPEELSKPLEFDFIFGYEGQKAELYTSK